MSVAFQKKYWHSRENKHSILCVGLDPAMPEQRDKKIISAKYLNYPDENEARLNFCLDIIDSTQETCCAYKPNQQYVAGFTKTHHQTLSKAIREVGAISILDYKLNDIGDSVNSALFHVRKWGYDSITFNPLLGNIAVSVEEAHRNKPELGIIVLVLTSNTEALRYQKAALINGQPLFLAIAEDIQRYKADGCVVGATGHVTAEEIRLIRTTVGDDKVFLVPGVGTQKGDPVTAIQAGGKNLLINVSRDIIYDKNPTKKAQEYNNLFNEARPF